MKIRFTLGAKQLSKLEKSRSCKFQADGITYEVKLAEGVDLILVPNDVFDAEVARKYSTTDKSKMN